MIVQCEACQTRFRLADEKVKPGGTKVRCSKCKEVFTVTPPEPESIDEAVDFNSSNMEKVTEDAPGETAPAPESPSIDASEPEAQPESDSTPESTEPQESSDLDFSALETEMASDAGSGEELAEDFSFADTSQPAEDEGENDIAEEGTISPDTGFSISEEPQEEQTVKGEADFGAAFEETKEPDGPVEFDFNEEAGSGSEDFESTETTFTAEDPEKPADFSFDEEEPSASSEEVDEPGEFSFDDESPSGEESAADWDDDSSGDDTSFDFEEPKFGDDDSPAASSSSSPKEDALEFGEIDFTGDDDESGGPGFQTDDDFSQTTMELQEEPEQFSPSQPSAPSSSHDYDDEAPLPAPLPPKKSSLSRILLLLVLLLVILGGAAGYLFMQEGSLNLNTVVKYLPFLQDYIGETPAGAPGDRIGINIAGSSYVNGQAGQMLVIQGAAVNNHQTTRSAITIKGVLLDAKGNSLLQQTVFCGNQLDDSALQSMPFAAIEEAMNNQFGDGLSNMNVAKGASIPFTIVFRSLPEGVANINVEVVDSKPGAG